MKKLKLTAICLVSAMLVGLGTSCANPPGKSSSDTVPKAAESAPDLESNTPVNPVDLSVLSEEEIKKISGDKELMDKLKTVDKNDKIAVNIALVDPLPGNKFDEAVESRLSYSIDQAERIESELQELNDKMGNWSKEKSAYSVSEINAVSQKIEDLNAELEEYDIEYSSAIRIVHNECIKPILDKFAEKYELHIKENYNFNTVAVSLDNVDITAEQLLAVVADKEVSSVYLYKNVPPTLDDSDASESMTLDTSKLNNAYNIIGGNVSVNSGYNGKGVVVGIIDEGVPDKSMVSGVTYYNASNVGTHATNVATIIKKMAPSCTIIATSFKSYNNVISDAIRDLINNNNVDIISISASNISDSGRYTYISNQIDLIIQEYKKPIFFSSGNTGNYVSQQSLAPNSISIGAVRSSGIVPTISSAFSIESICSYNQYNGNQASNIISMVNKSDFCAPGNIKSNDSKAYTSYSTPFAAGTLAQMMSKNTAYKASYHKSGDLMAKASLMASCFYNAGMERPIPNIKADDFEGAGVINAGACYNMAKNYSYQNYTITKLGTIEKGVTISDTSKPLRVAIAWRVNPVSDTEFQNTNIMLHVHKEGDSIATARSSARGFLYTSVESMTGPVVNYQVLEIPAKTLQSKGAGNYIFKIITNSSQTSSISVPCSLVWVQY